MKFVLLIPTYGKVNKKTLESAKKQTYDDKVIFVLQDNPDCMKPKDIGREIFWYRNTERKYALRNIVDFARQYIKCVSIPSEIVFGILDGDDHLTQENALELIIESYKREKCQVLWTNYTSDTKEAEGFSKFIPSGVDVYKLPWSSSHFKTFRGDVLLKVNDANFINANGNWFERCYDQALMLPLLHEAKGKHFFLNEKLYHYTTDKNTFDTIQLQAELEWLIRGRGYVNGT